MASKILWVAIPLLCLTAFILWALFPDSGPVVITPASPRPTISALPQSGSPIYNEADVTPSSVQAVIASLDRPDNYSRSYQISLYWNGGSSLTQVNVSVGDNYIVINGDTYAKTGTTLSEQDALARIPTYEEALLVDSADIYEAEYIERNNSLYIRVRFRGLLYIHEYYISISSGLLDYAMKYDGEALVYSMAIIDG